MSTMFISQGNRMDQTITLPLVNVSFQLPCATMSLFDSIAVMALVPLYEGVVAPALRRWGCPLSMLTRLCA
jgi:peptide/histidine transporter 3/4